MSERKSVHLKTCPGCDMTGIITKHFGMRRMTPDGPTRPQSHCVKCRKLASMRGRSPPTARRRIIGEAALACLVERGSVDLLSLAETLKTRGVLASIGGPGALMEMFP